MSELDDLIGRTGDVLERLTSALERAEHVLEGLERPTAGRAPRGGSPAAIREHRREREAATADERRRAARWVARALPDLEGDTFAIAAVLALRAEGVDRLRAGAVRKRRDELLDELERRGSTRPRTIGEEPASA